MGIRRHRAWAVLTGIASLCAALTACGSGDSTVAKTPRPATGPVTVASSATPNPASGTPGPGGAAADPCAVNLASPTLARVISELPRDPRSQQPWNPEPSAGNYNECAQLSAVIVKANTNAANAGTRAVLFHLGQFIPQGVPDTYGFTGIDASQTTGDTVALTYPGGINGLTTDVRFHWNGNAVDIIGKAPAR